MNVLYAVVQAKAWPQCNWTEEACTRFKNKCGIDCRTLKINRLPSLDVSVNEYAKQNGAGDSINKDTSTNGKKKREWVWVQRRVDTPGRGPKGGIVTTDPTDPNCICIYCGKELNYKGALTNSSHVVDISEAFKNLVFNKNYIFNFQQAHKECNILEAAYTRSGYNLIDIRNMVGNSKLFQGPEGAPVPRESQRVVQNLFDQILQKLEVVDCNTPEYNTRLSFSVESTSEGERILRDGGFFNDCWVISGKDFYAMALRAQEQLFCAEIGAEQEKLWKDLYIMRTKQVEEVQQELQKMQEGKTEDNEALEQAKEQYIADESTNSAVQTAAQQGDQEAIKAIQAMQAWTDWAERRITEGQHKYASAAAQIKIHTPQHGPPSFYPNVGSSGADSTEAQLRFIISKYINGEQLTPEQHHLVGEMLRTNKALVERIGREVKEAAATAGDVADLDAVMLDKFGFGKYKAKSSKRNKSNKKMKEHTEKVVKLAKKYRIKLDKNTVKNIKLVQKLHEKAKKMKIRITKVTKKGRIYRTPNEIINEINKKRNF